MKKNFKILALDGGGIRGLYTSIILEKIQENFSINFKEDFDLLVGTSTGSIIASCIALDVPIKKITELYEIEGKNIFSKRCYRFRAFQSKYKKDGLKNVLNKKFKNIKLGEIEKPLMIVSADMLNDNVYIHKSNYLAKIENHTRDKETKLSDAVLSSCSAPTYFNPQRLNNGYFLCDGGIWANNPSILGFTEAVSKFKQTIDKIFILSIGTGNKQINYDTNKKFWGFLTGWKTTKLIDYLLSLSSEGVNNISTLLLKENYVRINTNIDYELDDVQHLDNLKSYADKCFLINSDKIKKFLNK